MRRWSALVLAGITACGSPVSPSPSTASLTPEPAPVECGELDEALCASVAEAAELMTGTASLSVQSLTVPSAGGTPIDERYVVTLEAGADEPEPQLVEVVRLEGSDNWSVRRLESMPAD